ncbi:MAG: hypothetical protein KDD10_14525, partial [Phaeodactylibacter sp.]|nr:hypothetical protein [Phaeodactylibacter sp.]
GKPPVNAQNLLPFSITIQPFHPELVEGQPSHPSLPLNIKRDISFVPSPLVYDNASVRRLLFSSPFLPPTFARIIRLLNTNPTS